MANKDIKIVPVCFNILDPYQQQLYKHVCTATNRSGYIKRLVQRDMEGVAYQAPQRAPESATEDFIAEGFI